MHTGSRCKGCVPVQLFFYAHLDPNLNVFSEKIDSLIRS